MRSRMSLLFNLFVTLIVISITQPAFSQDQARGGISFMGTILGISPDFKSLDFFEQTIGLSTSTVVLHENGNKLRVQDLKPGLLAWVEAIRGSEGLVASRVVIQKLRRE